MAEENPILDIDAKYLQIPAKEDNPEKLLYMIGKPLKWFLKAVEFEIMRLFVNLLRDDVDELRNDVDYHTGLIGSIYGRQSKFVGLASILAEPNNGNYNVQLGDEKKILVLHDNGVPGLQGYNVNFPANVFSDGDEFHIYFLSEHGSSISYNVASGWFGPTIQFDTTKWATIKLLINEDNVEFWVIAFHSPNSF